MWSLHTMESNSALKTKEILSHAATGILLEDVVLREMNQPRKDGYCMIPLLWDFENRLRERKSDDGSQALEERG